MTSTATAAATISPCSTSRATASRDEEGLLYLAMSNSRRDSLLFTALSAEQIDRAIEGCVSRQKVLILDCCYSGAFGARGTKGDTSVQALERFQGRGRTVLTASDATQYSFEGDQAHGHAAQSVFTRYLVEGLRDGSADLDGDGDITLDELYSYVHDRVVEEMPQQRPKRQDNVEGRTVIASNINWTLPGYLRNAVASPLANDRLGALDGLAHLHRIGNERVRATVVEELRRLTEDDSRVVSGSASERLRGLAVRADVDVRAQGPGPAAAEQAPAPPSPAPPRPTPTPTPTESPDTGAPVRATSQSRAAAAVTGSGRPPVVRATPDSGPDAGPGPIDRRTHAHLAAREVTLPPPQPPGQAHHRGCHRSGGSSHGHLGDPRQRRRRLRVERLHEHGFGLPGHAHDGLQRSR